MQLIEIPDELRSKCGSNLHWDLYKVDVRLRSGVVLYNLSVRDKVAFEPTVDESPDKYNFQSSDIVSIRPATIPSRIQTLFFGW
ncbi:hypothetical protein BBL81_06320 [Vibrio parahaemolyticus]|uniref:hypothetical protein n=1 Tax=Vibrio parahaemolyticus TaxID=670 RepID=UPI00084AB00A|nr:hypothetical protein [Vibrio parahaemolyticus]EGQ8287407.1 hypothetical protein [Vibrio parahaemolyticus]EGQ8335523.1 hypothetical protein [Vibrio parahaemolyticus]EGR2759476.1 hypothetical protein [Vibrio parahaemolyticus]EJG0033981.1 hypothetical protein [Vibrio parahaemolyticus]ODW21920.1 hypothetical protein BBL80_00665 [Vibrio parahaemolyticus]